MPLTNVWLRRAARVPPAHARQQAPVRQHGGAGERAEGGTRRLLKALAFQEHGGLDKLRYQDVADPTIGAGDVLVRVRAAALNHLDLFVREGLPGLPPPMPFWTGCDIAGDVALVGAGVRDVAVGDLVAGNPKRYNGCCEDCRRGEHSRWVRH